jgi:lipopolysaccharide cholinephosphotransferase
MLTDTIPNIAVDILPIKPLSDTLKTAHKRTESLVSVGRKVVDSIHFTGDYKKCRFADLELLLPNRYDKLLETLYPEGTAVPEKPPLMSERKKGHCAYFSDSFGIADIAPPLLHRYIDVFEGLTKENPMGVYLFGAGDSSRIFKERYNKLCNIVTLFDNDPKKWGTIVNGLPVKSPEELPEILKNSPGRLIIASIYAIEIADGLERMGINDFYIFRDGFQY